MTKFYILLLDSHDCFGPFDSTHAAYQWAWERKGFRSFQILISAPFGIKAWEPK